MTTFTLRSLTIATLAVLIVAGSAQSQTASPVLNALEVQRLVASSEPADNVALSAHFNALANRYASEAARHTAIAQSAGGNPNRSTGSGMRGHFTRLAELNTASAATLRELASHHAALAAGLSSIPPAAGSRFHSGDSAPEPTKAELKAIAAKASSPADHRALEEYFLTASGRYTADANAHATMADSYRGTRIAQSADHCDRLVAQLRDSAKEATAAATMHGQLASVAR